MSHLIAIAYDDAHTARTVLEELRQLSVEQAVSLDDVVIVNRRGDGKIKLEQTHKPAAAGATGGALWGGLIGLIFLAPLLGMAVGAAAGGAAGAASDAGVDDTFMKELGTRLEPDTAALILLIREGTPDKVLPRISQYGGHVLQTSLSDDAERHLREALGETTAA